MREHLLSIGLRGVEDEAGDIVIVIVPVLLVFSVVCLKE